MQPYAAQADDIEAVLSRFQAWTGSKTGAKTGSRSKNDAGEGIREISYEEALRSSRHRWKMHTSELSEPEPPEPEPSVVSPLDAEPGVVPIAAPEIVQAISSPVENEAATTARTRKAPLAEPSAASFLSADFRPVDFRSTLARTVSSGETGLVRSRTEEHDRQVSMSLRVAASEQALIKLRAAEAGVSASAYLRKCALEVEQLRAQVSILLEISQSTRKAPTKEPQRFTEKLRRLFFREQKKPDYAAETTSAGWLHRRSLAG